MYKLIKIKKTGIRITVADGPDMTGLLSSGQLMQFQRPDLQFRVVDAAGIAVWPQQAAS